jgi:uncharacterized membrane protein
MTWFIVALGAPFVWSLVNHCDKIILSRYFKGGGSGGLMIFVGVVSIPLAIFIGITNPEVFLASSTDIFYLIVSGLLYNVTVFLYLKALEEEDASYIVPFWQLMPVFGYIFGVLVLGEYLARDSIIGGLIVIAGAIVLAIEFEKGKNLSFRTKAAMLMVFSSMFGAMSDVLFKKTGIEDLPFWVLMFWNQIGMAIFAIGFFADTKFRNEFKDVIKQNSGKVLSLNIFEQIAEVVGIIINNFAILLAPIALVILVTNTAQPLFVFIEGILLTIFFPKLIKENITGKHLAQKFLAIIIMGIGLYLITK